MRITTMHTDEGPMIGIGGAWVGPVKASRIARRIHEAVIDVNRVENEAGYAPGDRRPCGHDECTESMARE